MRRAVVDIGTNSTRLFLADVDDGVVGDVLERRTVVTRLGAGVDAGGRLAEDAMERVYAVLDEYRDLIDRHGGARAVAVMTSAVRDATNGAEFAGYDFSVQEIRECTRRIQNKEFRFTDYVLRGTNTRAPDAADVLTVRVRAVPNEAGGQDTLLLRVYDEFEFAEDFLAVLNDATGVFEVTDDKTGAKATFTRINDLRDSYHTAVLVVSATLPDGKGAPGKVSGAKIEYWDYWRDQAIGGGKTAKEFVFVEMNADTGWFQIWRGREFFSA